MLTLLRKAALIGLGLTEQAKEMVELLAKKGEENQSEEAQRIRAFFDSAEKGGREINQKAEDLYQRLAGKIKVPTHADIERLEKELADLAAQLRRWEGSRTKNQDPFS